jgi:transcriptional regulator with XRE-family HTH domain
MLLMTFGQKILSLRNQRGWSQRDLAKEIGGVSGSSGLTDAERQLRSLVDRFGAERLLWRLVEVGIGPDSSGGVEKRPS